MLNELLEKERLKYLFNHSLSRRLRRKMAKELGYMKLGWQNIKDEVPPYNYPMDLGINKFKKTGANHKDVLDYKLKARKAFVETIKSKEA